jgi:hypothetical protein
MSNAVSKISPEPAEFIRQSKHILKEIVATRNFDIGFDFIRRIDEMGETFNRAKALMFNGMDKAWKPVEHEGETFLSAAVRETSLSPETIIRHTRSQALLNSGVIPGEFREAIELAPENCRSQIANMIEDGFEPTHKDWLAISEVARDRRMLGKVVRTIRKVEPRTNWSMFVIDEKGILWRLAKGKRETVGELYVFSDSQFVIEGIEKAKRLLDAKPSVKY